MIKQTWGYSKIAIVKPIRLAPDEDSQLKSPLLKAWAQRLKRMVPKKTMESVRTTLDNMLPNSVRYSIL